MLSQSFMRDALLAGTPLALACGALGYFAVLRAQVFTGDALSHVAFTAALASAAAGVDVRLGLLAGTVSIAGGLAWGGSRWGSVARDDAATGVVFALVLGVGALLLSILSSGSGGNGLLGLRTLFGSIFGLSGTDVWVTAVTCALVLAVVAVIARPLLFATLDPVVAALQGVPVAALGVITLAAVGALAAVATQSVGALLFLGLLAAPAGAARLLASNPYRAIALSAGLAVACTWGGLAFAYLVPSVPPAPAIVVLAVVVHALALARTGLVRA